MALTGHKLDLSHGSGKASQPCVELGAWAPQKSQAVELVNIKESYSDFPGGLVVKTLPSSVGGVV